MPNLLKKLITNTGASFQLFLGGAKKFLFFNATGLLKNLKKQHFICSNLTLFIVPFFLFSLFLFFLFFSFFLSFFFFSFSLGGGATAPPQPPLNDASEQTEVLLHISTVSWTITRTPLVSNLQTPTRYIQPRSVTILQQGPARFIGGQAWTKAI